MLDVQWVYLSWIRLCCEVVYRRLLLVVLFVDLFCCYFVGWNYLVTLGAYLWGAGIGVVNWLFIDLMVDFGIEGVG